MVTHQPPARPGEPPPARGRTETFALRPRSRTAPSSHPFAAAGVRWREWHSRTWRAILSRLQVRAVATPADELHALLARRSTAPELGNLQLVAESLRRRTGLESVPPAVLKSAADRLGELAACSAGLHLLLLQMRREVGAQAAREAAAREARASWWCRVADDDGDASRPAPARSGRGVR